MHVAAGACECSTKPIIYYVERIFFLIAAEITKLIEKVALQGGP